MKNVLFDTGNAHLQKSSYKELDILYEILKENTSLHVQINGHTDNIGIPVDNLRLSLARADSVKEYVISKGIDSQRISTRGYGGDKPLESNDTEAGRTLNRRTEFEIK